jgi:hypothetical protein
MFASASSLLTLASAMMFVASGTAAELQMAKVYQNPTTFDLTVDLYAPGQSISSLQYDVVYNAGQLTLRSVQSADAVDTQGKRLWTSEPENGILRIVITGMNAFPILNGRVVTLTFVAAETSASQAPVRMSNIKAANPEGSEVHLVWSQPSPASPKETSSGGRRTRRR